MPLANIGNLVHALPWIIVLALIIFVPPNFLVLWAVQRMDPGRVGILLMTEVLVGSHHCSPAFRRALWLIELTARC